MVNSNCPGLPPLETFIVAPVGSELAPPLKPLPVWKLVPEISGSQQLQLLEVTSIQRQLRSSLGLDDLTGTCILGVQQRRLRRYLHNLGDLTDRHRYVNPQVRF